MNEKDQVQILKIWEKIPNLQIESIDPDVTFDPRSTTAPSSLTLTSEQTLASQSLLSGNTLTAKETIHSNSVDQSVQKHPLSLGKTIQSERTPRYQIEEEIGHGAMGTVFRAQQESLEREIAIKTISSSLLSSTERQLFIAESRVTGFLDHPNIVPVHDLGLTEQGNFILTMKLIGGRSWKEIMREDFVGITEGAEEEAEYLQKHIQILLSICNAVAFAHSKGIAHCDLKPDNVMVGEFGEVLVVDWGVAVDFRDPSQRKTLMATPIEDIDQPRGTPSYMAPELAAGQQADQKIGPWTDIYLLGALLYEVLTGQPPHHHPNVQQVLILAFTSEAPQFPSNVPIELQELCNSALDRRTQSRPTSVDSFRQSLQNYLSHRESRKVSRQARKLLDKCLETNTLNKLKSLPENERISLYSDFAESVAGFKQAKLLWEENQQAIHGEQEARAKYARIALNNNDLGLAQAQIAKLPSNCDARRSIETDIRARSEAMALAEKRRRTLARGFYSSISALLVTLIGGVVYYAKTNATLERQKNEITSEKINVENQKKRVEEEKERTAEEADRSKTRLGIADRALQRLVYEVKVELGRLPYKGAKGIRFRLLEVAREGREELVKSYRDKKDFGPEYAVALDELASILEEESKSEQALAYRLECLAIARRLVEQDGKNPRFLRALSASLGQLGELKVKLGDSAQALVYSEEALEKARLVIKFQPEDVECLIELNVSLVRLGELQVKLGDSSQALSLFEESLRVARRIANSDLGNVLYQEELARSLRTIGDFKERQEDVSGALIAFENSLVICKKLSKLRPDNRWAQRDLSIAFERVGGISSKQGDSSRSLENFEKAKEIRERLAMYDPTNLAAQRDWAVSIGRIAGIRELQGRYSEALESYNQCYKIFHKNMKFDPSNYRSQKDLSILLSRMFELKLKQSDFLGAKKFIEECLVINRGLAEKDKNRSEAKLAVALTLERLGRLELGLRDFNGALKAYKDAEAIYTKLSKADDSDLRLQSSLSRILCRIGEIKHRKQDFTGALQFFERSVSITSRILKLNPSNLTLQREYALTLNNIGEIRHRKNDIQGALKAYMECHKIFNELARINKDDTGSQRDLSVSFLRLAGIHHAMDKTKEALDYLDRAIENQRKLVERVNSPALLQNLNFLKRLKAQWSKK